MAEKKEKKPNLLRLNPLDFTKLTPVRKARIEAAPARELRPADTYVPNRIANALHPDVQYLKVTEIIEHDCDNKSYILGPDHAKGTDALAWFSAGQYLSLSMEIGESFATRPYSIASSPNDALKGEYRITVRRTAGGFVSGHILDTWKIGTPVTASQPLGEFTYEPLRDAKHIIGLAGGSGITPFRSLAYAVAEGIEDAQMTLLYGSRTKNDALFDEEFTALAEKCPAFRYVNVLSEETRDGCEHGFLTAELIRKYAPEGEYSVFVCGPSAMYRFLDEELPKLGLRRKFIRRELFGECRDPAKEEGYPGSKAASYQLTVRVSGKDTVMTCRADESLLAAMERAGVKAPSHCRSGECGWCRSKLVSGEVFVPKRMDGRREADFLYGFIHPCCTFPLSDIVLDVPPFHP
ncbi:MAG: 2Fe-2S iron-sulfur cluster binding domain-containing protein [Solobacterium sp.]|nr:2Fe-2S iron-sulfur cluster binding domain-containing protein [Solobacterium sp.]